MLPHSRYYSTFLFIWVALMVSNNFINFTRCQRADGTFYGTSGQCRKGREVDAKVEKLLGGLNLGDGSPKRGARKVGEGGYGNAYDLGNGVIIKKGEFNRNEVDAMVALKHIEGIPKLLGFKYKVQNDSSMPLKPDEMRQGIIAMSKVPGKTIHQLGSKKVQNEAWQRTLSLLKKIHEAGFVHGDMHEGNAMYDRKSKKVSIIDFGFAEKITKSNRKLQFDEIFNLVKWQGAGWASTDLNKFPVLKSLIEKAPKIKKSVYKMTPEEVAGPRGKQLLKELWDVVPDS